MRHIVWSALLVCASLATPTVAQDGDNSINLHSTYLPTDGRGFVVVDGARTLDAQQLHVGASLSHIVDPLEFGRTGDVREISLLRRLSIIDVVAAFGIIDGLSIGVDLPVVVHSDGRELEDYPLHDTRDGGLGALRLQLKWTIVDTEAFALALKPFITFPTGRPRDYLSDNGRVTGGGMLQTEVNLGRFRLAGEVGYEDVSSDIDIGDLDFDARLRFGLAVEVRLLGDPVGRAPGPEDDEGAPPADTHALSVGAELFGWTAFDRPFHQEREHPMEGLGFLRYRHRGLGLDLTVGAGAGLDNGLGASELRLFFGVGWTWP